MRRLISSVSCVKGCVVHGPWPESIIARGDVRVLINPANDSLTGPQRAVFPRGGPVLPKGVKTASDIKSQDELLYPGQAVDGLVHLQGGAPLRAALHEAAPIIETRDDGDHLRCRPGDAVLTSGVDGAATSGHSGLPFDAIVHTVPPFWPRAGTADDASNAHAAWAATLRQCYDASFLAAIQFAEQFDASARLAIATPVLGAGARGAPFASAAQVLGEAVAAHLSHREDASDESTGAQLRIVVHAGTMAAEMAAIETALEASSRP